MVRGWEILASRKSKLERFKGEEAHGGFSCMEIKPDEEASKDEGTWVSSERKIQSSYGEGWSAVSRFNSSKKFSYSWMRQMGDFIKREGKDLAKREKVMRPRSD